MDGMVLFGLNYTVIKWFNKTLYLIDININNYDSSFES